MAQTKTHEELIRENPPVYIMELTLRNGNKIRVAVLDFKSSFKDGKLVQLNWVIADPQDAHILWVDLDELVAIQQLAVTNYQQYSYSVKARSSPPAQ